MSSLGIVAPEIVRDHIAVGDIVAQRDVYGDRLLGGASMLFAQNAHLTRVVGAALDRVGDGFLEDVRAVEIQ
jgi:hypothetical protein